MIVLNNGLGETTGDALATTKPFQTSGNVWWVNSVSGTDASGTAGQDREKPLASLGQAVTNATAGDTVVCMSGHTETLTSALTIGKALTIVGGGSSNGKPGATFKINAAAAGLFAITTQGVQLRSLYFPAAVQADTVATGKVNIGAAACRIIGCYFESSGNDQLAALRLASGADQCSIVNTTFVSTATSTASRPLRGVELGAGVVDLFMDGVIFDDGTVGYQTGAFDAVTNSATITRLSAMNLSCLRGADIRVFSATGWLSLPTATGGARIAW